MVRKENLPLPRCAATLKRENPPLPRRFCYVGSGSGSTAMDISV
jgi:hypothetical protein